MEDPKQLSAQGPAVNADGLLYAESRDQWRAWLKENGQKERQVWLVFYKKGAGRPSLDYDDALDEALCYGWIDSLVKRIDETKYAQKFTPRRGTSRWSETNKRRALQLIAEGRMSAAGLAAIEAAKANGQWDEPVQLPMGDQLPLELEEALGSNHAAFETFRRLAPGARMLYIRWISAAKRPATREKRSKEAVDLLEKGQKLGLK